MHEIVLDGLYTLPTDLIGMGCPTFFHDRQPPTGEVNLRQIEVRHGGPAHPGFDQRIDDGAVAIWAIALAAGGPPPPFALALGGSPPPPPGQNGGLEQAPAPRRRGRPAPPPPPAPGPPVYCGPRVAPP